MNSQIDEEIEKNHNQAEAFISLFFAGLDAIAYIVIMILFGLEFKSLNSPKQKISFFLLLDFSRRKSLVLRHKFRSAEKKK